MSAAPRSGAAWRCRRYFLWPEALEPFPMVVVVKPRFADTGFGNASGSRLPVQAVAACLRVPVNVNGETIADSASFLCRVTLIFRRTVCPARIAAFWKQRLVPLI